MVTVPDDAPAGGRAALDAVAATASMVPLLPCGDVDDLAAFWTAMGLEVTYRQLKPYSYVALARGGIDLQYYGMPDWDPEASHSTCLLVVVDTGALYEAFAAGLRARYGRVPVTGLPRITRPRRRASDGGTMGFTVVDPAGNWIRVARRPGTGPQDATRSGADEADEHPLARALANAVVQADSRGDVGQGRKLLAGAVARAAAGPVRADAPAPELAAALAYLVELDVRLGDSAAARTWLGRLRELAARPDLADADAAAVREALAEARAVDGLERAPKAAPDPRPEGGA